MLFVDPGIALESTAGAAATILDAQHLGGVVGLSAGRIEGFTITGGFPPGPWYESGGGGVVGDGTIRRCVFTGDSAGYGGAVYLYGATPLLEDCEFISNYAHGGGGAIALDNSTPVIRRCTFLSNVAGDRAAGIYLIESRSIFANPEISDCRFEGNSSGLGGVLYAQTNHFGYSPLFTNCTFRANSAVSGGVLYEIAASTQFVNCLFIDNQVSNVGGVAFLDQAGSSSIPLFDACRFQGNSAARGGVIYAFVSEFLVRGSTLAGSMATLYGAGIAQESQGLNIPGVVENSIIAFSTQGEAVWCDQGGPMVLRCSNVFANSGGDWVGCIAGQAGASGNISMDPLFCDRAAGDLTLQAGSPCLPGNHPSGENCGLIGALAQGCATTATEATSWGEIKGLFR
jgi:hypothetical protein